jgi:hypothetical protein
VDAKSQDVMGWQRQAESSELGDGGFPVRRTIAKASGLDAATRLTLSLYPLRDFALALTRARSPSVRSAGGAEGDSSVIVAPDAIEMMT